MKRPHALAFLTLLPCFAAGCLSLADTTLSASDARYPVSLTPAIVDTSGRPYTPTEAESVGHFRREWRHWAMAWGAIPLSSDVDLKQVLEEEIDRLGGNGIVNMTVESRGSGLSWVISLLLIFPENVKVVVEGDVIRTSRAG